jgi:hypothetical protein
MAVPSSLKDYSTQLLATLQTRQTAVQTAVTASHADSVAKRQNYQALIKQLADLDQQIEGQRQAMARALMPADAEAALAALRLLIIQHRRKRAALLDSEDALESAKNKLESQQTELMAIGKRIKTVESELAEATARVARHLDWQQQLADEPLSTIRADSSNVLTPPALEEDEDKQRNIAAYAAATTRMEGDIPAALRLRATNRGEQTNFRLGQVRLASSKAEDLYAKYLDDNRGPDANVINLKTALLAAESRLGAFVMRAKERFDAAISLANQINASPPLTPAELAEIDGTKDPDLVTHGEAAVEKETVRDEKRQAVSVAQTNLDVKTAELLAADIDVDLLANAEMIALQDMLTAAQAELGIADGELTAELKNQLDEWEAAIPDSIWKNLFRYNTATQILNDLKDTDPAVLTAAVQTAESALITGLIAAEKKLRTFDFLNDNKDFGQLRLRRAEQTHQVRVLSAVRGDK